MNYDYMAQEWHGICKTCKTKLYAPNKFAYLKQFDMHTHSNKCLGGW